MIFPSLEKENIFISNCLMAQEINRELPGVVKCPEGPVKNSKLVKVKLLRAYKEYKVENLLNYFDGTEKFDALFSTEDKQETKGIFSVHSRDDWSDIDLDISDVDASIIGAIGPTTQFKSMVAYWNLGCGLFGPIVYERNLRYLDLYRDRPLRTKSLIIKIKDIAFNVYSIERVLKSLANFVIFQLSPFKLEFEWGANVREQNVQQFVNSCEKIAREKIENKFGVRIETELLSLDKYCGGTFLSVLRAIP